MQSIKPLLILILTSLGFMHQAFAQLDFNKALCVSNEKREESCSVTITKKSILLKYSSGRNESIKKDKIKWIASRDESKRRGFIFTRVDRRYLYTIEFLNVDNDSEKISIAFDELSLSKEFDSMLSDNK